IVGVLLVSALMTLPVASAMRLAKGFKQMVVISIVLGEIAVIGGLISGYYFNIPPGGTIVVISIFILLIILILNKVVEMNKKKKLWDSINIETSIKLLQDHGYKKTARRKAIIDFFIKDGGYRTAKEVTSFIAIHYKGISYDTVYRN